MKHTELKLNEAKYFLEQMERHADSPNEFVYNLSAFLCAARSVTFVMQEEFSRVPGFRKWYSKKQKWMEQPENKELFEFFKDLRNVVVHQQPVIPKKTVNLEIAETVAIVESLIIEVRDKDGNLLQRDESDSQTENHDKDVNNTPVKVEYIWYFDEKPEIDVVILCRRYIEKLESLVVECIERFS